MPEDWHQWLADGREQLRLARKNYNDREFAEAIRALQLAEEIAAKVVLMRSQFITQSPEVATILNDMGVRDRTAKAYNHDWHKRYLRVLDQFTATMNQSSASLSTSDRAKSPFANLDALISDFESKLTTAKTVNDIPVPSLQDLDAAILQCNSLIQAASNPALMATTISRDKIPSDEFLDKVVREKVDAYSRTLSPTRRARMQDNINRNHPDASWVKDNWQEVSRASVATVALAILNVYLWRHHTMTIYPGRPAAYDSNLSLVVRFKELATLVEEALNLAEGLRLPG